jgi:hypothetical protein
MFFIRPLNVWRNLLTRRARLLPFPWKDTVELQATEAFDPEQQAQSRELLFLSLKSLA